jgi:RNA polymerase sigma factor (sigma-70 family)
MIAKRPSRPVPIEEIDPLQVAFLMHYEHTVRLCLLLSGSRDRAEDMAQEAFLRVSTRLAELPAEDIRPYLRTIVVNVWKNSVRRMRLERREAHRVGGILAPQTSQSLEEVVIQRSAVWTIVRSLPSRQRACVVLRFYEDLSEADIALVLGCRVGTVKSQTSRALERIRKAVEHES